VYHFFVVCNLWGGGGTNSKNYFKHFFKSSTTCFGPIWPSSGVKIVVVWKLLCYAQVLAFFITIFALIVHKNPANKNNLYMLQGPVHNSFQTSYICGPTCLLPDSSGDLQVASVTGP
jgi:hypothetical protein